MKSVEEFMEGRSGGELSLSDPSVVARMSRHPFAYSATIKTSWKRIVTLIGGMLAVVRFRQLDDSEQRANKGASGNLADYIQAYSPILQWLRGRD